MTRTEWIMDALFDWKAVGQAKESSFAQREMGFIGARQSRGDIREGDDERLKELRKYSVDHDFDTSGFKSLVVELTKQSANMLGAYEHGLERAAITAPAGFAIGGLYGAAGGTAILPGGGTAVGAGAVGVVGYGVGFTGGMVSGAFDFTKDLEGGHAYLEYRELGFTHSDAAWAATIAGNINGLAEAVGGQIIFSKLPGVRSVTGKVGDEVVKQLLGRTTFRQVAGRAARDWGIGVSAEIATEITQEATTITMGEILKAQNDREDMLTGEEWASRIADIAEVTLKSTVLIAGLGPGQRLVSKLVSDGKRARDAKARGQAFKALGESSKDSKLRKNVAPKYREFVEMHTKEGAVDNILIDAERFDTYFQEQGKDPDQVADELGIENLAEARELGIKVEIPTGAYAEKIAPTPDHEGLTADLTSREGDMTTREAEEFDKIRKELEKEVEQMAAPIEEKVISEQQAMLKDVTQQLVQAGTEAGSAQQQAQIFVGFLNLDERMGFEPGTLFKRMFAGVRRDLPEGLREKDIDVFIDPLLDRLRSGDLPTQREMMGESLVEMIKDKGGLVDEGGEISSRDWDDLLPENAQKGKGKKVPGLSLDAAAELASEAGFIADYDQGLLMEAVEAEMRGEPVFGRDSPGNVQLQELSDQLDQLASFIQAEDIDLEGLSNADVRALLEGAEKFEQQDFNELVKLIEALSKTTEPTIHAELLNSIAAAMPHIFTQQDFGDLTFTDTVRIQETGETAEVTENVQKVFDRAVKRKNVLKRLLDCVSG